MEFVDVTSKADMSSYLVIGLSRNPGIHVVCLSTKEYPVLIGGFRRSTLYSLSFDHATVIFLLF